MIPAISGACPTYLMAIDELGLWETKMQSRICWIASTISWGIGWGKVKEGCVNTPPIHNEQETFFVVGIRYKLCKEGHFLVVSLVPPRFRLYTIHAF